MAARFLVVSEDHRGERAVDALDVGGIAAHRVHSTEEALGFLQHAITPVALDARIPGAESFVAALRADQKLSGTPVVALIDTPHDAAYSEALGWGVDEVLPLESLADLPAVARSMLRLEIAERPPATRGTVVLAAGSSSDRRMRARPLAAAGFSLVYASNADELAGTLDRERIAFVLADADLFAPDVVKRVRSLITADPRRHPWILVASTSVMPELLGGFRDLPVGFVYRNSAPEDALFVGNDLLSAKATDGRASPRLLHATVAAFRTEGTTARRYGFTYNISREGLYVRTLTPPALGDRVWIEARPLEGEHLVHLEATVVWVRPFSSSGGATAPAGFGARITDATARDLERWRAGYSRLATNFMTVRPTAYVSFMPILTG